MIYHHDELYRTAKQRQQEKLHEAKMARWTREASVPGHRVIDRLAEAYASLLSILL